MLGLLFFYQEIKNINFQGKPARTKNWFGFYHEWLKEKCMTREPDLYKKLYQTKLRGDTTHEYNKFGVPIGNAKMTKKVQFCTEAPLIKYQQKSSNSCCLSSLASSFHYICDNRAITTFVNLIE